MPANILWDGSHVTRAGFNRIMYLLNDPFEGNESVESQFGFSTEARDCDSLEPANNDCLIDELYRTSEKEGSAVPSAERRIKQPSLRVSAESELARYVQRGSLVLTPNAHNSLSPEALSAKQFKNVEALPVVPRTSLSPEELTDVIFVECDKDRDGRLSEDELNSSPKYLKLYAVNLKYDVLKTLYRCTKEDVKRFLQSAAGRTLGLEAPERESVQRITKAIDKGDKAEILAELKALQSRPEKIKPVLDIIQQAARERWFYADYTTSPNYTKLNIGYSNGKFGSRGLVFDSAGEVTARSGDPTPSLVDSLMQDISARWRRRS